MKKKTPPTDLGKNYELVILDMDDVLADFFTSALDVLNAEFPDQAYSRESWPRGHRGFHTAYDISFPKFWQLIDAVPDFWTNMKPTKHVADLIELASELGDEVVVMTSPSMAPMCSHGKRYWYDLNLKAFRKVLPFKNLIIGSRKELLARPNRLLIDDSEENVEKFRLAGGTAILYPCLTNAEFRFEAEPVRRLRNLCVD